MLSWPAVSALLPYGIVAWAEFRSRLHYLGASLAGFVTQYAFGLIRAFIILTLIDSSTTGLGGYTRETAITYTWATQAIVAALGTFTPIALASRIRSGDIAIDLIRPLNLQLLGLAQEYGLSCYHLITRGILVFVLGMATFGVTPTFTLPSITAGLVALWLAVTLSYALRFLIATAGFWVVETRAIFAMYMGVSTFFGGFMIPVHLFPGWLQDIAYAMPFLYVFQTPIDIITGFTPTLPPSQLLLHQIGWLTGTLALGYMVMRAGIKKVEVQGG